MSYRRHGHARVDPNDPDPFAICDRCGMRYNISALRYQREYAGTKLLNLQLLVCERCTDTPQEQKRTITIPTDPVPTRNPRPRG